MVFRCGSLSLRLSGESQNDSGVVPDDESSPLCDIDDIGEATDVCWDPCLTFDGGLGTLALEM